MKLLSQGQHSFRVLWCQHNILKCLCVNKSHHNVAGRNKIGNETPEFRSPFCDSS